MKRVIQVGGLVLTICAAVLAGSAAAHAAQFVYKNGDASHNIWQIDSPGRSLVGGYTRFNGTPPFTGSMTLQTLLSSNGSIYSTSTNSNGGTMTHLRVTGTSRCRWVASPTPNPGTVVNIYCRSHT